MRGRGIFTFLNYVFRNQNCKYSDPKGLRVSRYYNKESASVFVIVEIHSTSFLDLRNVSPISKRYLKRVYVLNSVIDLALVFVRN